MKIAALILLIAVIFCQGVSAGYSVQENITVETPRISFAELVDWVLEEEIMEKLGKIDLGPAPGKGEKRQFSRQYLEYLLRRENIDFAGWEVPGRVNVKTDLVEIRGKELEERIAELLGEEIKGVIVEFPRGIEGVFHPRGEVLVKLEWRGNLRIPGSNTITAVLSSEGLEWEKFRVPVFLDREVQVYRVINDLPGNQELNPDFLRKEYSRESDLPRDFIGTENSLEGFRARRELETGTILCSFHLEEIPLVERGEEITILFNSTDFSISVPGKTMEDGKNGEIIRVRNLFNGEIIQGKIKSEKIIEIDI